MRYFIIPFLFLIAGCARIQGVPDEVLLPEIAPEEVPIVEVHNQQAAQALTRLDHFLQGQTGLLFLFLIFQAIQLWYFSKTGEESETIKKASDGIYNKMGFVHRLLYKYIRYKYYKDHPDKPELPKKDG